MSRRRLIPISTLTTIAVVLAVVLPLTLINNEPPQNGEPVQYPMEVREAVIDEALSILQARGFWPEIVAGLGYGADSINLLFYGEADPEVVNIVKRVIDNKAPGLPLEITENVTIVTQTSDQWDDGYQFVEEILDLLRVDSGWVPPLPPSGGEKPRILTEEEKDRVLTIASAFPKVVEAKRNKDVVNVETQYVWIGWNGNSNGASHLMHGAVENGTANLSNKSDTWYPAVKFIFTSKFGKCGIAGINVAVNLETGKVMYSGGFIASDIIPTRIPPELR